MAQMVLFLPGGEVQSFRQFLGNDSDKFGRAYPTVGYLSLVAVAPVVANGSYDCRTLNSGNKVGWASSLAAASASSVQPALAAEPRRRCAIS
jgi:hypothetical protein